MLKGQPNPPSWTARLLSAVAATLAAGLFFGYFGTGIMAWNTPFYWIFLVIVFLIGLLARGKID